MIFLIAKCSAILSIALAIGHHLNAQPFENAAQAETINTRKLQVTGLLKGLKEDEQIFITKFFYPLDENCWHIIDTVEVANGKFYFEDTCDDGPRLYNFSFSKHNGYIVVCLDKEQVVISSEKDIDEYLPPSTSGAVTEFIKIDGSKTMDDFIYLDYGLYRLWFWSLSNINSKLRKYNDSIYSKSNLSYLSGLIDAKSRINNAVQSALTYPTVRKLTPELFTECQGEMMRDSMWVPVYNLFDNQTKNSYNGKVMKEYLPLCMGQRALNFEFPVSDGKIIDLNSIIKKNRLTVLHFWSSGSVDRTRIHNEIALAYKKYKPKGLEVVSVSFDASVDKWKRSIESDKIPGFQFCDFKEEESPISQLYKVHPKSTINLLIDQDGKMLAWDVDGSAFFAHLYKFFGE